MRLLVIGGSDAGIAAALRARELDPAIEVTVVVADAYPNFSICGLPYYLSGDVADWRDLAHRTTSDLEQAGIQLLLDHTAQAINPAGKQVTITSQHREWQLGYDRLVVGNGAVPVRPPIDGLDLPGVHMLHTMGDTFALHQALAAGARSAVIVGGGYIGLEMAEAFTARGLAVTLVEQAPAVMPTVDLELGRLLGEELRRHDVEVVNDVTVKAIYQATGGLTVAGEPDFAATADLVLVAVGVRPDTKLAVAAGVQTGARGALRVDRRMRTNLPDVLAAGDCVETWHRLLEEPAYLPAWDHRAQAGPGRRRDRRRRRSGVRWLAGYPGGQGVRAGRGPHRPPRPRGSRGWVGPDHRWLDPVRPQGLLPGRPPAPPAHHRRPPHRPAVGRPAGRRPPRRGRQAHRHPCRRPVPPHDRGRAQRPGPQLHPTLRQPLGRHSAGRPRLGPADEGPACLTLEWTPRFILRRMALTVSALADQAGLSPDTVRYYERVGLLPEPARSAAGYRLYDQAAVGRLRLIKGAQRAGLRLREIGELLQVADRGLCPCGHTEILLRERLTEVRAELDRLRGLETELTLLLERQPDPSCPDMTAGAAAWWCAPDCPDSCEPSEGR
jgi:NADPH-dependent 2,4-dienoyl-CoA reductase/sulfur reductase-like enzyme/DNA-binding transcriptional MerR regulator